MRTRREFFRDAVGVAAGAALWGSGLTTLAAGSIQTGGRAGRRQVTVGGRRVKTIDLHAHCVIPGAMELMGQTTGPASLILAPDRLQHMDEQGIDVEVLGINPFWYSAEPELARRIVTLQNEQLSALCAARPDRFVGLASVVLQQPEMAAGQLEEGIKKLGLRGALIGASVNGEDLSLPKFHPFWARAEELGVVVFIHPQGMPELSSRLQGNGLLTNVIGNPLETTIALSHLIFEGTLDRFPGLKICGAHGGGYLPSYAGRSDRGCVAYPERCSGSITLKKHPAEYLKQLYFDSLVFTGEGLRHLVAECGASQIVLGTDAPFPWAPAAVDHVLSTPGLSDADREAILGGNASRLLRLGS